MQVLLNAINPFPCYLRKPPALLFQYDTRASTVDSPARVLVDQTDQVSAPDSRQDSALFSAIQPLLDHVQGMIDTLVCRVLRIATISKGKGVFFQSQKRKKTRTELLKHCARTFFFWP